MNLEYTDAPFLHVFWKKNFGDNWHRHLYRPDALPVTGFPHVRQNKIT